MNFRMKKVRLTLYLSLLGIWSMLEGIYSDGLSHIVFVEIINPSGSGFRETHLTDQNSREECFRFFLSYFSDLFETELKEDRKTDFLASVKYSFLHWLDHSKYVQILHPVNHVLVPLEKSRLISKLRESGSQSLVITENYVIYKIFFRELDHSLVYNVLNTCDHFDLHHAEIGFDTDKAVLHPKKHELLYLDDITASDQVIIASEGEQDTVGIISVKKILDDYFRSRSLFTSKIPYKLETNQHEDPPNDLERHSPEERPKKLPSDTVEQVENKDVEEKRKAVEDGKKELSTSGELEDNASSLGEKRANLRVRKKRPYKKVKSSYFYVDTRPVVSNQVYLYEK